jgi:hypothetical protein
MFFSKEADSFLNGTGSRATKESDKAEHLIKAGSPPRLHFAEGDVVAAPEGDVVADNHRHGRRVCRAEGDAVADDDADKHRHGRRVHRAEGDVVEKESHLRGRRVHARSHHADMDTVEPHNKGHSVHKSMGRLSNISTLDAMRDAVERRNKKDKREDKREDKKRDERSEQHSRKDERERQEAR